MTVWAPATVTGIVKLVENAPDRSVVAVTTVDASKVMVMLDEDRKLDPDTVTEVPTIPVDGVRLMVGIRTVRVACPVRVPASTPPVTVNVNVPPGVEFEVEIVSGVDVGLEGFDGNAMGLLSVVVVLEGAPVNDNSMVAGRPVVVEPDERDTVTV